MAGEKLNVLPDGQVTKLQRKGKIEEQKEFWDKGLEILNEAEQKFGKTDTIRTAKKQLKKKIKKSEKKERICITLTNAAKIELQNYSMERGFTGISALIEFWAHNLHTIGGN